MKQIVINNYMLEWGCVICVAGDVICAGISTTQLNDIYCLLVFVCVYCVHAQQRCLGMFTMCVNIL